ncbi:hypothetical protein ACFRH4_14735 [Streptomyces mirabilis]|uniref:hypothetical protein n=1 Tax=Streptomyces mirabilis TaxID=68239 RepID=UPI00369F039E
MPAACLGRQEHDQCEDREAQRDQHPGRAEAVGTGLDHAVRQSAHGHGGGDRPGPVQRRLAAVHEDRALTSPGPTLGVLVGARLVQGLGAAVMLPAGERRQVAGSE